MVNKILLEPAYVLHQRPYRDTSLLLEVFSPEYGRLGLVARGVKGKNNQRRALLQPFIPLTLSWSGRGELGTLTDVEADGSPHALTGPVLLSGFYLNELLLHLLHRHDPHPELFAHYRYTLQQLGGITNPHEQARQLQVALRLFEKQLLQEIGYGLVLEHEVEQGEAIEPETMYRFVLGQGPMAEPAAMPSPQLFKGSSLLALAAQRLDDAQALRDAKRLTRLVLDHYLAGRKLHSRQLLQEMQRGTEAAALNKD
jgi:DNA repair protein RecO (recombination protein O)